MGVKAISLPDELIKELEEAAKRGNRGFSAEVRMRCEAYPTGVAEDRLDSGDEISGEAEKPITAKVDTEVVKLSDVMPDEVARWVVGPNVEPVPTRPFRSFMKGEKGKFEGVSELAKKIAKDVPGVKVASEFKAPAADEMPDLSKLSEPVISAKPGGLAESIVKSAKKRPVETEGRVELVKGFWRETFDSVGDAMVEVAQKGWREGEYTIKPVEKLNTTKP